MLVNIDEVCFNNLVDYWKALATDSSLVQIHAEHIPILTGVNNPLFNPIFSRKSAEVLPPKIPDTSCSFWYDSKRNQTIPLATVSELEPIMEHIPVMSIRLDKEFKQEMSSNVVIEILKENNKLSDWIMPVQAAFQMDNDMASHYRNCLEKVSDKFVHFMVKIENEVVAAASIFLHAEIAGFYNLSVIPEYRKKRSRDSFALCKT